MRFCLFFYVILMSFECLSITINSPIHAIEDNIVKFSNGRVAFINHSFSELKPHQFVSAKIDESSNLVSFKILRDEDHGAEFNFYLNEDPSPFSPTVVKNHEEAKSIFERSNPFYKRISECTDRAHVWAHEEYKFSGIKSLKAFVFFTASYINSVRFKWWFHVAPMYRVDLNGILTDMVMDYRYSDKPLTVKEWTDLFVFTKRSCKVTTQFSEYDVNPQTENCYLIFESMHYKVPDEIYDQERYLRFKNQTTENEITSSRKLGFE